MMISQQDHNKIIKLSKQFGVTKVLLFGSSLQGAEAANDIDLAVEGVADKDYYRFCGELIMALSKPVDIVDLDVESSFNNIVREEGIVLYE